MKTNSKQILGLLDKEKPDINLSLERGIDINPHVSLSHTISVDLFFHL